MDYNNLTFFNYTKESLQKEIQETYASEKDEVIERANRLLEGVYLYQNEWDMERTKIPVTMPLESIDWNYAPTKDLEWSYMLHRHSYLMDLILASIYTEDNKYIDYLLKFLNQYVKENPYNEKNKDYSWRTIDTAIRLSNLVKIYEVLRILDYELSDSVLKAMSDYYDYVYENLLESRIQSNWTAIEASGAIVYAIAFKRNQKEIDMIHKYYQKCLRNQILPDGLQWEQSFMYHHEVLITALNVVNALKEETSKEILRKTQLMVEASLKIMRVDYKQINYGDSDIEDMRSLLLSAEKILNIKVFDIKVESTLYDFMFTGNPKSSELKEKENDVLKHNLEQSGIAHVSNKSLNSSLHFIYGPLGGGHGHDDLYHLDWFVNGTPFLVDSGRYTYYEEEQSRLYFKHPKAHNTLFVDDKSFNNHRSAWSSTKVVTPMNEKVIYSDDVSFFEGGHLAYSDDESLVYVNRKVLYTDHNVLLISDSINSNKNHKLSSNFVFNKDKISISKDKIVYVDDTLEMNIFNLSEASTKQDEARISPQYNHDTLSTRLELYKDLKKGSITTLITPSDITDVKIIPVANDRGKVYDRSIVECVKYRQDEVVYYLMIQHEEPQDSRRAYLIEDELVYGRIIHMSKEKNKEPEITVLY